MAQCRHPAHAAHKGVRGIGGCWRRAHAAHKRTCACMRVDVWVGGGAGSARSWVPRGIVAADRCVDSKQSLLVTRVTHVTRDTLETNGGGGERGEGGILV
eukprot:27979-Chlamydomonas_euryale.AAC.1